MNLDQHFTWDWKRIHLITDRDRTFVRNYFSPFDPETGKVYPPQVMANVIAEFSKFFFGDQGQEAHWHIRTDVPEFHKKIYRDLAQELRYYYITCPSEFGKTSIATLVYPIYRAMYKLDAYITVGGSTQQLSEEEHFDNLKRELEENEKLLEIFGDFKPKSITRLTRNRPWSASEIELPTGVVIRALGCMGKIRGRKTGAIRPTLVIIDDPEEAEDVDSEALLSRHRKWLFRNVMYRIDGEVGKIRLIGNMLSDTCLLATVKRDRAWKGVDYSALDDNDRSIWEDKWPTAFLLKERQTAIDSGRYEEWMYERMNRPVMQLSRRIPYKSVELNFARKNDQNLLYINDMEPIVVNTFLGIDPEIDAEDWGPRAVITSCKGYFPTGENRDVLMPCTFALNYLFRPLDPSDIIDAVEELHEKYYYSKVAIESNTWQRVFHKDFNFYMATNEFYRDHPFQFIPVPVSTRKSKIQRILRFQNMGKRGMLFINADLRALMDDFDNLGAMIHSGLHLADAFEMGDRYAEPPAERIRAFPNEDVHVNMRLHTPWKDMIKKQTPQQRFDAVDHWKSIQFKQV